MIERSDLRVVDLAHGYGRQDAIHKTDITWHPGLTVLLGPNGAGKSTLLAIAAGLIQPSRGAVRLDGLDAFGRTRADFLRRVGHMQQGPRSVQGLTCLEQVEFSAWLRRVERRNRRHRATESLRLVGLDQLSSRRADRLSGGETRRLNLAEALTGDPQWVLLDEPTAGLDPDERSRFCECLKQLANQGVHRVVATHWPEEIIDLATRVMVMNLGSIVWDGTPEAFRGLSTGSTTESYRQALDFSRK